MCTTHKKDNILKKTIFDFNSTAKGDAIEGQATEQPQNASQAAKSLAEYEIALTNHVKLIFKIYKYA